MPRFAIHHAQGRTMIEAPNPDRARELFTYATSTKGAKPPRIKKVKLLRNQKAESGPLQKPQTGGRQ